MLFRLFTDRLAEYRTIFYMTVDFQDIQTSFPFVR